MKPSSTRYVPVALWTLLIFCTIPLAEWIQEQVPERAFTWGVAIAFIAAALGGLIVLRRGGHRSRSQKIVLLAVAAYGSWQAFRLAGTSAAEAVHYVEYAVLTALWIRAGLMSRRDESVFLFALMASAFTGIVDESFQWLLPDRVFDFRDMGLNIQAAVLGLVWIRFGMPGEFEHRIFRRQGRRGLLVVWSLICLMLGFCFTNTPERAERLPDRFPSLKEWSREWGEMAEYGFRYTDQEIGEWKSRLTPDQLSSLDLKHAVDMTRVKRDRDREEYKELLLIYPPGGEPFLHEYLVHQFRLNRYRFKRNKYKEDDYERYRRYCRVAVMEHRILSQVFPNCYQAFGEVLPDFVIEEAEMVADLTPDYFSPVSQHLIVRHSPGSVLGILCLIWVSGMLGLNRLLRS